VPVAAEGETSAARVIVSLVEAAARELSRVVVVAVVDDDVTVIVTSLDVLVL
jgi:hypothetical protein